MVMVLSQQALVQTGKSFAANGVDYFLNQFRHIGGEKQPIQCQPTLQVYLKLSPDTAMLLAPFGWPGYAGPSGMRNNLREPSHTVHTQFLNFNLLNKTPASPCYACCPCKSIQATPGKTDPTTHTCNPTKKVCSLQSYWYESNIRKSSLPFHTVLEELEFTHLMWGQTQKIIWSISWESSQTPRPVWKDLHFWVRESSPNWIHLTST